jgi:hypothetical protein
MGSQPFGTREPQNQNCTSLRNTKQRVNFIRINFLKLPVESNKKCPTLETTIYPLQPCRHSHFGQQNQFRCTLRHLPCNLQRDKLQE